MLVERLDKHGDPFRTASVEVEVKPKVPVRPPRVGAKTQTQSKQVDKQNASGGKKPAPKRKSKADKVLTLNFMYSLSCIYNKNSLYYLKDCLKLYQKLTTKSFSME